MVVLWGARTQFDQTPYAWIGEAPGLGESDGRLLNVRMGADPNRRRENDTTERLLIMPCNLRAQDKVRGCSGPLCRAVNDPRPPRGEAPWKDASRTDFKRAGRDGFRSDHVWVDGAGVCETPDEGLGSRGSRTRFQPPSDQELLKERVPPLRVGPGGLFDPSMGLGWPEPTARTRPRPTLSSAFAFFEGVEWPCFPGFP